MFNKIIDDAKSKLLKEGKIDSCAILIRKSASPLIIDFDTSPENKEDEFIALKLLCQAEGAIGLALIAEAWMTLGKSSADDYLKGILPSQSKNRREVLMISYADAEGVQSVKTYEIVRTDGRVSDFDDISISMALPGLSIEGSMSEIFSASDLKGSEKKKLRDTAMKIRKKNRKGRG